ncbi:hypothetical protein [Nocardioides zhouii]|uniref:LppX_LprAFG lipoprotein n=1 Tax=Nocardioides zhouii TaxID=1168729 RepID=A0A4Q2SK67_9ACTN|nr:hypothetical protein [Nocardioides zhouii]RYC05311.1 hypothetical protein EUA94_19750 [Nocardioides zhouii]
MNVVRARQAVAAALAALLLTSCGSLPSEVGFLKRHNEFLDQSPHAIAKAAFADMQKVKSLRILGTVNLDDEEGARMDVRLEGSECVATFDVEEGSMTFLQNDKGSWIRPDNDIWRSKTSSTQEATKVLDRYAGKWFDAGTSPFAKLCNVDKLLKGFEVDEGDRGTIDVGKVEKVGDVDAIPLSGRDGKKRCTLWIAVEAPHHVVKLSQKEPNQMPEVLAFEEFGAEVDAPSPDKKDIVVLPGS